MVGPKNTNLKRLPIAPIEVLRSLRRVQNVELNFQHWDEGGITGPPVICQVSGYQRKFLFRSA